MKNPFPNLLRFTILILLIASIFSCVNHKNPDTRNKEVSNKSNFNILEGDLLNYNSELKYKTAVRSILEDSKGNYWFGSWQEGVCRYDGISFTYFTTDDGLSDNQVRTIQEDQNGNIWFATGRGISMYDGEKISLQATPDDLESIKNIEANWKLEPNDIWFNIDVDANNSVPKGICRYDNNQLSFLKFPDKILDQNIFKYSGTVTGISKRNNDRIWFCNYNGFFGYDGKDFIMFDKMDKSYHVRSIFEDSKGNLWIGNNGSGVLFYDGEALINFSKKQNVHNPKYFEKFQVSYDVNFLARVFSIGEDTHGNIWFGTVDAGAWKFDGEKLTQYTTENGLTSLEIMEIYTDKKGVTWFGMGDGSVCQFNGKYFKKIY